MWTAVPPAKSMTEVPSLTQPPSLLAIQPPYVTVEPASSVMSNANTQCATGKYTIVAHTPAKTIQAPNRARSAIAPEMSATVRPANMSWKVTNSDAGIEPASAVPDMTPVRPKSSPMLPSRPAPPYELPNAAE